MEQTLIKCEDCIYFKSSSYHDKMWCRDCQQHNKFKPKNMKYTEGIAFDGTAILEDGNPITITEILSRLNDSEQLQAKHEEEIKQAVPEMTFKDWIKELVDFDDNYSFLLEGTQTGEIFDMHDYYMEGLTPHEAMSREYYEHG